MPLLMIAVCMTVILAISYSEDLLVETSINVLYDYQIVMHVCVVQNVG